MPGRPKSPFVMYAAQAARLFLRSPKELHLFSLLRHYSEWAVSLRKEQNSLTEGEPWLTYPARDFLRQAVRPDVRVFEYGTGGSSVFFLKHGAKLMSVEHDTEWAERVRKQLASAHSENWKLFLVPPEPMSEAIPVSPDNPADYASAHPAYQQMSFRKYAEAIDAYPDSSFDIVLVDGRSRPSCYRHAHQKVKPGGLLILDNSERTRYRFVHDDLRRRKWARQCFPGPGPFGKKFWETCVWRKPDAPPVR